MEQTPKAGRVCYLGWVSGLSQFRALLQDDDLGRRGVGANIELMTHVGSSGLGRYINYSGTLNLQVEAHVPSIQVRSGSLDHPGLSFCLEWIHARDTRSPAKVLG